MVSGRIEPERFVPFRLDHLAVEVGRALARVYGGRFAIDIPKRRATAMPGPPCRTRRGSGRLRRDAPAGASPAISGRGRGGCAAG